MVKQLFQIKEDKSTKTKRFICKKKNTHIAI